MIQKQNVNLVESKETEISESENAKFVGENNVACTFYSKGIVHHEFVIEKQTVNSNFCKEVIKRLIARVHCIRREFQESGSWYLLHDNALVHFSGVVSEFLTKRGTPVLSHPPYSPDLAQFFYF
jgi:histone-lysine N-methyltransferase SETMAR